MTEITKIIKSMPEGKRKRACLVVASRIDEKDNEDSGLFWESVRAGAYGAAADYLLKLWPNLHGGAMLADMIWEGGA
jgi:hypothetical protein